MRVGPFPAALHMIPFLKVIPPPNIRPDDGKVQASSHYPAVNSLEPQTTEKYKQKSVISLLLKLD